MKPVAPKDIPALFQSARAAQGLREYARALQMYDQILAAKPDLAEVHFNIAQIAAAEGQIGKALSSLKTAAKLKPAEPAIWAAWIDVAKGAKDRKVLAEIAKLLPKSGVPAPARAQLSARLGGPKISADEAKLRAAVKANKSSAGAHRQLGEYLLSQDRAADALAILQRAVKLGPNVATTRMAVGYSYLKMADYELARAAFAKAASLGLSSGRLSVGQGMVALAQKDDAAVAHFETALALDGPSTDLHMMHAAALRAARQDDAAFAAYDAALAFEPDNARIMTEKAALLQNTGQLREARALLARGVELEPENGSLFMLYASAGKLGAGDPVMERAKALFRPDGTDRSLAFAMSKVAEAEKIDPFPYWARANALTRTAYPYTFEADAKAADEVRAAWRRLNLNAWQKGADPGPTPIFVTGMPRSGTTLIEQIIAAHSDVTSAGEVGILGRYLTDYSRAPDMDLIRRRYWQMLQARFPGVGRITDKSISTYVKIGFIKTILPSARIVVVKRDPRDNALSIYKNMFADGQHRYSNDLADIARFMRLFEAQVAFWNDEMPDAFTTIRYDDVIADPEGQSRQLISDVGLDWQDACLSFYDSKSRVDTLSNVQVRQPIYASSVGAWKKYEAELAPFLETYGPIQN